MFTLKLYTQFEIKFRDVFSLSFSLCKERLLLELF